jgi:hypothetical protein
MLAAAAAEFAMGRKLWGVHDMPGIWSGDVWSRFNSQFVADPYAFTHITHGILFFALCSLVFEKLPFNTRLLITVGLESAWEVLENTNMVIERYRMETISLNYYGDSVVNSMADILACMLGFFLASRLPKRVTVFGTIGLEVVLLLWTRDNLAMNIVMLIYPSAALRNWQLGQ